MSAKFVWPCALVLALLSASVAPADVWYPTETKDGPEALAVPPSSFGQTAAAAPRPGELSSWIKYGRPGCCDPVGGDGPILMDIYVRVGPSLPVAGGTLNNTLATGWMVQGGGRSLFFNPEMTAAWTVDLNVAHIVNNGNKPNLVFPGVRFRPATAQGETPNETEGFVPVDVSVRALHRTFVGLGLGREWYLNAPANSATTHWAYWRFGFDGGARLGTARMDLNEVKPPTSRFGLLTFQRLHDVYWSASFALHTDVEVPCGCCTFSTGFRAEWQYDWLDIFPLDNRSNLHSVNLLWSAGVRY